MGKDQENKTSQVTIGANTVIQFTVKSFLATVGSILGLFVGFYFMVVAPKAKDVETYQRELFEHHKEYVSEEFDKVNSAINVNTTSIKDLADRFNDLNESFEEIANSGGSFGGGTAMGTPAVTDHETALASNVDD